MNDNGKTNNTQVPNPFEKAYGKEPIHDKPIQPSPNANKEVTQNDTKK
jgi:hypothetical protein